jgi:AcrR family transcriptional regulator
MSPGLIYRYFASKSEIILAIIEHQLELSRSEIGKLHDSANLPLDLWRSLFQPEQKVEHIDAGLYAEMSAEAARDPAIGAAVAESDRTLREAFCAWLARGAEGGGPGLPAGQARAVGLLIQCLMDGLRLRRLREPELDAVLCKRALRDLLTPWLEGVDDSRDAPGSAPRAKTRR